MIYKHGSRIKLFGLLLFVLPAMLNAQSTFKQVRQLLQANCAGSGCHSGVGGGPPSFNVSVSDSALYNTLINGAAVNPTATSKFNKLVIPGDVQRSFLLRKMAHGISDGLAITAAEGAAMPSGLPALANFEIELIRQWILFGAPFSGEVVDTALINTYYRNGGIDQTYSPHLPPAANEGFQIYVGRIFLPPNTEKEYFVKYNPHFGVAVEGKRVVTMMPSYMHHFVLYSFTQGGANNYREGLRPLEENSMESVYNAIGTASGLWDYELPEGTAYFFDQGMMYDVNSHCINTLDTIVSSDLYINVYTEPLGTADDYMFIRNYVNEAISIPQDSLYYKFTVEAYDTNETQMWKIWKLYTHTHKYGTKFDVFLRNADGTKGERVYDGNYSYENGFDMGYYRWGIDVTFRTWPDDSLFEVDPRLGFIYEATYRNTGGPNPVNWGMTSVDEMMAMGFHFIYGDNLNTGLSTPAGNNQFVKIIPNPSRSQFALTYELEQTENVQVELFNLLGEKTGTLITGWQEKGKHSQIFRAADYGLRAGVYFLTIRAGNVTSTEKIIITN